MQVLIINIMDYIQFENINFEKYISNEDIDKAVKKTAEQINQDYQEEAPVFLISLNGAIFFAVDLIRHLNFDVVMSCIKVSSYQDTKSSNKVKSLIGLNESLENKRIVILEDIVDSGLTYQYMYDVLQQHHVKDIRIACMTFKETAYQGHLKVHYPSIIIPDKFVIGRGLDYNGHGRHLKDIYQICNL